MKLELVMYYSELQFVKLTSDLINCIWSTSGDNEQWSNSKVQNQNTKEEQSKNGPLIKLEEESGAMEEWAFYTDQLKPPCNLCRNRENEKFQFSMS